MSEPIGQFTYKGRLHKIYDCRPEVAFIGSDAFVNEEGRPWWEKFNIRITRYVEDGSSWTYDSDQVNVEQVQLAINWYIASHPGREIEIRLALLNNYIVDNGMAPTMMMRHFFSQFPDLINAYMFDETPERGPFACPYHIYGSTSGATFAEKYESFVCMLEHGASFDIPLQVCRSAQGHFVPARVTMPDLDRFIQTLFFNYMTLPSNDDNAVYYEPEFAAFFFKLLDANAKRDMADVARIINSWDPINDQRLKNADDQEDAVSTGILTLFRSRLLAANDFNKHAGKQLITFMFAGNARNPRSAANRLITLDGDKAAIFRIAQFLGGGFNGFPSLIKARADYMQARQEHIRQQDLAMVLLALQDEDSDAVESASSGARRTRSESPA